MERPYHLIESKIKKIEMFVFPNPIENGTIEGFEQFEAGLIAAPRPEDGEDDLVVTGDVVEGNPLSVAHEGVVPFTSMVVKSFWPKMLMVRHTPLMAWPVGTTRSKTKGGKPEGS